MGDLPALQAQRRLRFGDVSHLKPDDVAALVKTATYGDDDEARKAKTATIERRLMAALERE